MGSNKEKILNLSFVVILVVGLVILSLVVLKNFKADAESSKAGAGQVVLKNISAKAALSMINDNKDYPDFIILDVRTPGEFASGYIEKAVNINFYLS